MPYKVQIQNEQSEPLAGVIYLWSDGSKVGESDIPIGGTTLSDEAVEQADHFTVESPGYSYYGTSVLYNDSVFTLARKPKTAVYVGLALVGGFLLSKLVKFKI